MFEDAYKNISKKIKEDLDIARGREEPEADEFEEEEEIPAYFNKQFQITISGEDLYSLRWNVIDGHDQREAIEIAQFILGQIPEDIMREIGESKHE